MAKQTQPLKPLIKTWTGWERGIGYLPESDEDETKGLYYANGILGIHGELRPAPFFRNSTLKSHILRRIYDAAGNREAAAIALQIPNAVQGTQPTVASIASKNGTSSSANAAEFFVGTFNKSTTNDPQTVNHGAAFTVQGAMFWSADGERTTGGTSTAVNTTTLTDSGATWVTNEWVDAVVTIPTSGGFGGTATITGNTGTVLTFSGGWSSAGDPTDETSVYTLSWDATSKVGAGGMIGFADGTTANDRSISWNAEDNSGDVPIEVVETLLNSGSDTGTIDTISIHSTSSDTYTNPTPFNNWGPWVSLFGGKMNLITIASSSAINNDAPTSFTLSGATITLVESITISTTSRISIYRSAPSSSISGWSDIDWSVNQTDATIQKTTFNRVVVTGTNGADGIVQSDTATISVFTVNPHIHLSPLNKTGNAMFGAILISGITTGIAEGTGFTEIDEQILDLGNAKNQVEWRIGAENRADPEVDWVVNSQSIKKMIGLELAVTTSGKATYVTDPYTPHANRLVLLAIDTHLEAGSAVAPITVTGSTGLSWLKVEDQGYDTALGSDRRNISVWRALKTSGVSSGTDTISFNSIVQDTIRYIYTEYANVNLTINGTDAVQQSSDDAIASTTTPLTTLGTFGPVDNATYGAHGVNNSGSITAGSGFALGFNETDDGSLMTEFREDNDTSVDASCTSGATGSIAIEIEFAAAGSGASNVARSYDNSCIHFVNEDALGTFPSAICTFTDDNNFSLAWSNNASGTPTPTPDAINFMLFGGTDVDAEVVEWTNDIDSGEQEVIGVNFPPTCLITIGAFLTSQTTSTGIDTMFGITDETNQFAQNFKVTHGAEPSDSTRRTTKTYSVSNQLSTETTTIENFDPSGGTGFTWNHTQTWATGFKWATLALKGVKAEVGQFTRETSSGGQAATSISITSDAFILTSLSTIADDTNLDSASWSMGAASELGEAAASAWTDETAQNVTDNYALDWEQASVKTISNGEDTVWVELNEADGTFDTVAGVANMDIGVNDWLFLDGTDSQSLGAAVLINYVGFTAVSDPKFSTDSFNATGNSDANTELIVAIATDNDGAVNSVVFNTTEALTQIAGDSSTTDTTTYALEIWHLTNPSASTATIVIDMSQAKDIIVGIWLVEGASSDFDSGTFKSNDVDTNDYFSAGAAFNQPDVSLGKATLNNIDLILGVSVDNSEIQDSGSADSGVSYTATTATDTGESLAINVYKGYTITGTKTKSSMSVNTNTGTVLTGHQPGWGNGTPTGGAGEDAWEISGTSVGSLENISFDEYKTAMHMVGTYLDTLYHKWQTHWYIEESIGTDDQYLYISRGRPGDANNTPPNVIDPPVIINKIDLRNSTTFGNDLGFVEFTDLTFPGQLARYKGNWFFPSSGTSNPRKLTVGTGEIDSDTWPAITDAGVKTVEHLANGAGDGGFQLVGMRATEGWRQTRSEQISGSTANPSLEADWSSYFGAGDRDERAAGLAAVGGGDVFLNKDGLWSYYPGTGRSSLIFEDFKIWRSLFDNIPISPWRGGLLIPHPSGLLFWTPGQLPINIGFDAKTKSYSDPPTNVTNFNQGRYLGVVGVGDYIYTLYQPDITSSEVNVLCGYLHKGEKAEEIVWQVIGTTFLFEAGYNSNVGISLLGRPISADFETPTLWFNNGNNMSYIYLDDRAGPFRSIQRLTQTGFALLPELFFPERVDMSEMIIYTQGMRPDSDSWQVSMFADNGTEIMLGSPIYKNGRSIIKINRHNVYRVMFKLTWDGQSSSEAPKTIGTDIATVDSGGSGVDTITSTANAFGDFIVGDEINITTTGAAGIDDGDYTLVTPVSAGTLSVVTGSFTGVSAGKQITVQSRHRESPAIKRIELYGQPTTRGSTSDN